MCDRGEAKIKTGMTNSELSLRAGGEAISPGLGRKFQEGLPRLLRSLAMTTVRLDYEESKEVADCRAYDAKGYTGEYLSLGSF